MLRMIKATKFIRIKVNALNLIIKACLNLKYEDKHYSMTYYFKKLSLAKQIYDIANKKLLIIVTTLQY